MRLRYSAWDNGRRVTNGDNEFIRAIAGIKGRMGAWDYDTAILHSETTLEQQRKGFFRYSILKDALGNPASPYFPYRIGVNSNLNPASLYAAMSPTIKSDATSKMQLIDFRASRDLMKLDGGPMSVALGAEYRREETSLTPTTYTDTGDILGLGYSAYNGKRNITAAYAELLAPVTRMVELSASLRADKYSTYGNSTTPKLGVKFTPVRQLALRGTYAEGFRAPNAAEAGTGGLAAFTTASDPVRCPGGNPAPGATAADCARQVAIITTPDPNLKPEESKGYTLGAVWDPLPNTSVAVDIWEIKRSNEINQTTVQQALVNGSPVTRQDDNLPGIPNSGTLLAVTAPYVNSASTKVNGWDVDVRQRFNMGEYGRLTLELRWSRLSKLLRTDKDGTQIEFAGTHGNCDVTNCIGTPKDKANFIATWDQGNWRVAGIVNYRGAMSNKYTAQDESCAYTFADGSDAPNGCKIPSFWTLDVSARWQMEKNLQVFGSIQNLTDKVAPLDPTTYGALSFNPLDISGAVGRFYNIGVRYQFK